MISQHYTSLLILSCVTSFSSHSMEIASKNSDQKLTLWEDKKYQPYTLSAQTIYDETTILSNPLEGQLEIVENNAEGIFTEKRLSLRITSNADHTEDIPSRLYLVGKFEECPLSNPEIQTYEMQQLSIIAPKHTLKINNAQQIIGYSVNPVQQKSDSHIHSQYIDSRKKKQSFYTKTFLNCAHLLLGCFVSKK